MFTKLIAPVLIGGALLGSVAVGGTAFAATTAPAAPAAHAAAHPAHAAAHPGRAWLRAHRRALRRSVVVVSASTIGITPKALVTELRAGSSIAQVADEHHVSASTVESALVTAADADVAQAVSAHELTQAQADKITAALPARITKVVDRVR